MMKRYSRYTAALVAFCLAVVFAASPARAAGTGDTIHLADGGDLRQAVEAAKDGDTIVLEGTGAVNDPGSKDAPWIIDKALTIQGGTLNLRPGGIILEADVTFRGTTFYFASFVRNAVMANGHTLTLEDVTCGSSERPLNLFCGGLYDPDGFGSTPGPEGKIVIRGKTDLRGGRVMGDLFAGNLCMGGMTAEDSAINGPANAFAGNASISIETDDGTLGTIYAGGAQERIPEGSMHGKEMRTDPEKYTVTGTVRIRLQSGCVPQVDGRGAGAVHVTYTGDRYVREPALKAVSSLTVESGYVAPAAGSSFREGAAVSVADGGRLGLSGYGDVSIGSFTGGGALRLGREQTLTIAGAVTGGPASVAIGDFSYSGGSLAMPKAGHVYIRAPQSESGSFRLAPPDAQPDMAFVWKEAGGEWIGPEPEGSDVVLVESLRFQEARTVLDSGAEEAALPLEAVYAEDSAFPSYLDFIPLTVSVNGTPAVLDEHEEGYYIYIVGPLSMEMIADELTICAVDGGAVADGTYAIEVAVPGTNTGSGEALKASAVLVVGEEAPGPDPKPAYKIESVTVENGSVVCAVSAADGGAELVAASYTADGRLLRAASAAVGGPGDVRVRLDTSGAGYVRAFLLDSPAGMRPVCGSVRKEL